MVQSLRKLPALTISYLLSKKLFEVFGTNNLTLCEGSLFSAALRLCKFNSTAEPQRSGVIAEKKPWKY